MDYKNLGELEHIENPSKNDFQKLNFTFENENTIAIKNRRITMFDDWRGLFGNRYWHGKNGSSRDNESENLASYHYELVFYSDGLT